MTRVGAETIETVRLDPEDRARAGIYRLLGAVLAAPPDARLLESLRHVGETEGPLAGIWDGLRSAARGTDPDQVEDEFHRLFIGLGRGELVPYASVYLSGFLMEQPLADLRRELQRFGMERREGVAEPEDHAAALCEAMGLLIEVEQLDLEQSKVFFDTFIGAWLGRFFQDLAEADAAEFYRAVSALGQRFMAIEQAYYAMPT